MEEARAQGGESQATRCREVLQFIDIQISGELDNECERLVADHLDACPDCASRAFVARRVIELVKARIQPRSAPTRLRLRVLNNFSHRQGVVLRR